MGCAPSAGSKSPAGVMVYCNQRGNTVAEMDSDIGTHHRMSLSEELIIINSKDGDGNSFTGQMRLRANRMNILLVFGKEDTQCHTLRWAAERGGYNCYLARSVETAQESYNETHHDLVIVDCRHSKPLDYENICRSLKSTYPRGHSVFLAVSRRSNEKDEASILPLLNAGFTRRLVETTNIGACLNELISIERGELRAQLQLQACSSVFTALQNISESIEVTDKKLRTEFVNNAFERYSGYKSSDVIGQEIQDKLQVDNCNEEERLVYHMNKGLIWEGQQSLRKKDGETVLCKCRIVPIESSPGKVMRHVVIRTPVTDSTNNQPDKLEQRTHEFRSYRRGSYISISSSTEGLMHVRRRESLTRIQSTSMTLEAPITKIINIICETQANSPSMGVVQALDKVLEILQSPELFSPHIQQVREEDPVASDLVGGLCDQNNTSSSQTNAIGRHTSRAHKPISALTKQSIHPTTPDIQTLLEKDASWSFDIIKLETLTSKGTLVPLGMKIFTRFGVCEHLGTDESTLAHWLHLIGTNYHEVNPYHNATHAADVLQATAYFLDKLRPKKILDTEDEVAALIAAVIHDVDHPARTSSFLVNNRDKLAILYNDIAVLENHHAAMGFLLTNSEDKSNILKNLDPDEYEKMRRNVIDMVLATEMAKHFENLQRFIHICKANMRTMEEDLSIQSGVTTVSDLVINSPENRRQILRMLIKCADVSNPARELKTCEIWANRIAEEYFQQTDEERARKLPVVMPAFDRETCSIPHSQLKFIEVFLLNMFEHWDAFLDIPEVANQLQSNYKYWRERDEAQRAAQDSSPA